MIKLATNSTVYFFIFTFFYLVFIRENSKFRGQQGKEEGGYFFNSSLQLPAASQTLTNYPGNYCRERIPSSKLKSLHIWLRALKKM